MEKLFGSKKGKIALAVVLAVVACAILIVVEVNSSKVSQNSKRIMASLPDSAAVAGMTDGISEETVRNGLDHAQSGWTVKKTSNTKSDSKDLSLQTSKAAYASKGTSVKSAERPVESDFSWYWDRETQVPAGAKTLTGQDLAGSWKTMAFSTGDDEPVGYYSLFNSDVTINGSSSSLKADWYVSYSFSIEDGQDYYWFDESVDADVRYGGSYISEDNALVVWDDASSFMFISSDYINGFMINSWYEYDNKQYATGAMFDKNDECIGTVALVRDTAVKVPENDKKEANRKIEEFSYTWWSEDGDEWKDKSAIKISYENGTMSLVSYSFFFHERYSGDEEFYV